MFIYCLGAVGTILLITFGYLVYKFIYFKYNKVRKVKPGTILVVSTKKSKNPFINLAEELLFIKVIDVKNGWAKYKNLNIGKSKISDSISCAEIKELLRAGYKEATIEDFNDYIAIK